MKNIKILLVLICFGLFLTPTIFAQATDNGGLEGTVYDPNGAVVPNATVTVKNTGTGATRTAVTNTEGRWKMAVLSLGNYEVKVEATGFSTTTQTASVESAVSNSVDIILTVGVVNPNEITVKINDGEQIVSTENSATTTSSITGEALEQRPTVRSPFATLQTDTSASGALTDPLSNGNGNPEISINGNRPTSLGVLFNGIDATNFSGTGSLTENISPAIETVQEVKLLSSLYDASLGRTGGGSVQLITRRGENTFTGSAYFYGQNEAFNANDFFFNRDGIDRQVARRLEGGFTVGGPIIKDKFFFFGGYQRTQAKTAYVPSAQSFVILPEALIFITDRTNAENVRQAFVQSVLRGGVGTAFTNGPSCVRILTPTSTNANLTCIDPTSVGFRLLSLRNPATGDFIIPSLPPGRFERLYLNTNNVGVFSGNTRITDFSVYGLPNGLPLLDSTFQGDISGGLPLVRFRNVFPAEFKQDQITTRLDYTLYKGDSNGNGLNTLSGSFFYANFPAFDPFSSDTLVSPTPLIKDDRNRTLSVTNTHIFSANIINEVRFGYFYLDNSRRLDERFLADELTNSGQGIFNPASVFAPGAPTQRLARFAGTGNLSDFSVNAPTDIFNQRRQTTLTFANNLTFLRGNHAFRFGVEHKRNFYDTNLPEEQGIEFEGLTNFTQLFTSFVPEADVTFGITDKQFRFNDLSFYVSDDWRVNQRLTVNIGLRWDWFGLPVEKNGRFANFDFSRVTDPNDIRPGFILPSNVKETGVLAIDGSLSSIARADSKHTLESQDLNNFAPRIGFAFKPFNNDKTILRGGYGIFYDRPSAAFINTIYSNYPFFKEIELKNEFRPGAIQAQTAFINQIPTLPFSSYLPFQVLFRNIADESPYVLNDNTPGVGLGNGAEPLEFRAIDRNLKTPLVHQWNLGIQQQIGNDWTIEARYVGTRGRNLLTAVGFNQPYDLNDPNTPDYIFGRLNDAISALFPGILPPNAPGLTQRMRGMSMSLSDIRAFGGCNPAFAGAAGYLPCNNGNGGIDLNLTSANFDEPRAIINADLRVPYLGFDPTDAVILQSRGYSFYHSAQLNVSRRISRGFSFNASYTFSKSIDIGSSDPGSTAASGRSDTSNFGLVVQGDQRNIESNRAVSDFDRTHRFSFSFTWKIPNFGSNSKIFNGWQMSGFGQWQSGTPFSIYASNSSFFPQASGGAFLEQYLGIIALVTERNTPLGGTFREVTYNVGAGSGSIYNLAFGRPSVRNLELLRKRGRDFLREYFNTCQDPNNSECALISPLGGFGNLGRNILRGPSQKRFDISIQKQTKLSERIDLELKMDIFNVFNFVNYDNPNSDLSDETDFGQITRTIGAPRVMQFGIKLRF